MITTTDRTLELAADSRDRDSKASPATLWAQVLDMHNREHEGSAQYCDRACCRTAAARRR